MYIHLAAAACNSPCHGQGSEPMTFKGSFSTYWSRDFLFAWHESMVVLFSTHGCITNDASPSTPLTLDVELLPEKRGGQSESMKKVPPVLSQLTSTWPAFVTVGITIQPSPVMVNHNLAAGWHERSHPLSRVLSFSRPRHITIRH